MNQLTSTGLYFSSPTPAGNLPALPGGIVSAVRSTASPRGMVDATPPIMVGEFRDPQGTDFVMLVNLSLELSANIEFDTLEKYRSRQVVSAVNSGFTPLDEEHGHWLLAGHGVFIKLETAQEIKAGGGSK